MKLAIIGLGHVAQYQIEAIGAVPEIDLVAANDIDPRRAASLPTGVSFVSDLDRLLDLPDIDLFLVSTPNLAHYEVGRRVLEARRPLLLEKPCSESIKEMNELVALSKAHDQLFLVALHAAYGRDVLWYVDYLNSLPAEIGPLTGFHAGFFDPYYQDGTLVPGAKSLGGSWFDSGINALSVVGRFVDLSRLSVVEGRMTAIPSIPCSEIQAAASFDFWSDEHRGNGIIETNWCLGINQKITSLFYALTHTRVTLNHTEERVVIERADTIVHQENLATGRPRLTNHYINVFTDVVSRFGRREDNLSYAVPLHRLLFEARLGSGK